MGDFDLTLNLSNSRNKEKILSVTEVYLKWRKLCISVVFFI